MSEPCPAEGVAQAYLERQLDRAQRAAFECHLAACGLCRDVVRLLGSQIGVASGSGGDRDEDSIGPTFDRFRLERRAGSGAFGTIWFAHDPRIDRKVALKILAPHDEGAIREARALGRIVHPNLVTVFEVGEAQARPYLVMEWIDGVDLRRWSGRRSSWREIVEALIQAGRGLAALHGVGVLHRDIKPANVIIDEAGRVRVVDLGLASFAAFPTVDDAACDGPPRSERDEPTRLVGSPAYMAPELWRGRAAHEGSDQFSFGVTLFECLYGVRPFVADTPTELLEAMGNGDVAVRRGPRRVPGWLRAVILRGLAPDPGARWPSVQALIAALERGLARRRRWRTVGVAVGLATIVGGTAAGSMQRTRATARCHALGEGAAAVWNAERATELAAALVGSSAPHAEQTSQRVIAGLDAHAKAWSDARIEVCEATEIDGRVSRGAMTNRAACLDEALVELRATLEVLARADEATLDSADAVLAGLRTPADCIDGVDASSFVAAPDDAPISAALARARALRIAGDPAQAHELASSLLPGMRSPSQRARVLLELAVGEDELGRYQAGKTALDEALTLALSQQDWSLVQQIATVAISVLGSRLGQPEAGLVHAELARGLLPRSGALHARSAIEHNVGHALVEAERFDEASAAYRRAIDFDISRYGARHPEVATSRDALGSALRELGDLEGAIAESRLALEIRAETLGPHHRALAHSHGNLAIALGARGELAEAESHVVAAIDIENRYVSRGPDLAALHTQLGIVRAELGRSDEALAAFERAWQLNSEAFGSRDAKTAETLLNLAFVRQRIGDLDRARVDIDAAIAILGEARGPRHLSVARAHGTRASILASAGDFEGALADDRMALSIKRETLGDMHVEVARSRSNLGETLIALERWTEAIAELEQAVTALPAADAAPASRAHASIALARALAGAGRDLDRARALAVTARDLLAGADGDHAEHLAEIDAVIADLGAPSPRDRARSRP